MYTPDTLKSNVWILYMAQGCCLDVKPVGVVMAAWLLKSHPHRQCESLQYMYMEWDLLSFSCNNSTSAVHNNSAFYVNCGDRVCLISPCVDVVLGDTCDKLLFLNNPRVSRWQMVNWVTTHCVSTLTSHTNHTCLKMFLYQLLAKTCRLSRQELSLRSSV